MKLLNNSSPAAQYKAHFFSPYFRLLLTPQSSIRSHDCHSASFIMASSEILNQLAAKFTTTDCCIKFTAEYCRGAFPCECPTTVQAPVNLSIETINGSIRWDRTAHNNKTHAKIITTNNTHDAIPIKRDITIREPAGKPGVSKSLG